MKNSSTELAEVKYMCLQQEDFGTFGARETWQRDNRLAGKVLGALAYERRIPTVCRMDREIKYKACPADSMKGDRQSLQAEEDR